MHEFLYFYVMHVHSVIKKIYIYENLFNIPDNYNQMTKFYSTFT